MEMEEVGAEAAWKRAQTGSGDGQCSPDRPQAHAGGGHASVVVWSRYDKFSLDPCNAIR